MSVQPAQPSVLETVQGNATQERFAKMHQEKKWFDSGEYFLSKEGKVPSDMVPGGAPADSLPPKLSAEPAPPRQPTNLSAKPLEPVRNQAAAPVVSDY